MEHFSADWLALREPADHAARARALTAEVAARLADRPGTGALDLAAGTGSNVRYLMPHLAHVRRWTLVDHDQALLDEARRQLAPLARTRGCDVQTLGADLAHVDALPIEGCGLVTASALLDLVSDPWLCALARRCREAAVDVLFALTYDGRIECDPVDAGDARVRALVHRHMRGDKGFGPALGPDAPRVAEACFRAEGFSVRVTASDWVLDETASELQRQLVTGWASAAQDADPDDAARIAAWRDRRVARIDAGQSRLLVGHIDLAAWTVRLQPISPR